MKKILIVTVIAALAAFAPVAEAETINLESYNASGDLVGSVGGTAVFLQGSLGSGTGIFPAFVQVAGNNLVKSAYNTTVNGTLDVGSSPTFNHEIQVQDLTVFEYQGQLYYEFLLDINENNNNALDQYLSLDDLTLLWSPTANQSSTPLPIGTIAWDMNNADDVVLLNYALESGSGVADMIFLVPVGAFAGAAPEDYVYLYSAFGGQGIVGEKNYYNSDGFEEWALRPGGSTTVPDGGATAFLLGLGMLATGIVRRFRR